MSSKAQKKHGYPLPVDEFESETQSYCVTIPAGQEYFEAFAAQLSELGHWWFWKRSEARPNAASDAAMTWRLLYTIEEDCGGSDMATKDDIRDGMYEAFNRLALQIASGTYANLGFTTDADGIVTPTPDDADAVEVPEDDPVTTIDETIAAKAGGIIGVQRNLQAIVDAVALWWTQGLSQPDIEARLVAIYGFDPTATTAYMAYYFATVPTKGTAPVWVEMVCENMYTRGVNLQTLYYYIYQVHPAPSDRPELLLLLPCITQEMLNAWYAHGTLTPSTDYQGWSCTPIPVEEFDLNMSTGNFVQYTTSGVWKKGHRFLIETSGGFTDSDQPTISYDSNYKTVSTTGVHTYWPLVFGFSGVPVNPDGADIPYSPAHVYAFTVDVSPTATSAVGTIGKDNGDFVLPNTTGLVHVKVTDLGQASV